MNNKTNLSLLFFSFLQRKQGQTISHIQWNTYFLTTLTHFYLSATKKKLNLLLQFVDSQFIAQVHREPLAERIYHLEPGECESTPDGEEHVLPSKLCIISKQNDEVSSVNPSPGTNSHLLRLKTNYWLKINSVVISFIAFNKPSPTKLMCLRTCYLLINEHYFFFNYISWPFHKDNDSIGTKRLVGRNPVG